MEQLQKTERIIEVELAMKSCQNAIFFTNFQFKDRMENHNKASVILSIKLINKTSVTETFEHIAPMPEGYPWDSYFKVTPK